MKVQESYVTKSKILVQILQSQYPRSLAEVMMKMDSKSLR